MAGESAGHVKFPALDENEEDERTKRGWEHRKDLVRGIKFQQENDKKIHVAQVEFGYDWLKDESRTIDDLSKLQLGIQLTIHGFLVNYQIECGKTDASEKLSDAFEYFKSSSSKKPLNDLGMRLKEQLALIAILLCDNEYGIPLSSAEEKEVAAAATD